jgi:hypothetical protein
MKHMIWLPHIDPGRPRSEAYSLIMQARRASAVNSVPVHIYDINTYSVDSVSFETPPRKSSRVAPRNRNSDAAGYKLLHGHIVCFLLYFQHASKKHGAANRNSGAAGALHGTDRFLKHNGGTPRNNRLRLVD